MNSPPTRVKQYRLMTLLHHTHSTFVYSSIDPNTFEPVIVKLIDTSKTPLHRYELETSLSISLSHPYILNVKYKLDHPGYRVLVSPRIMNGDLHSYIKHKRISSLDVAAKIMFRLVLALDFLHSQHILHGDVKDGNILMKDEETPAFIDFGFATIIEDNQECHCHNGTGSHASPELLSGNPHSYPSDIWSLGVTFYTLLRGKTPFEDYPLDYLKIVVSTKKPDFFGGMFENAPQELRTMVKSMMEIDPKARPTAHDLLYNRFFEVTLGKDFINNEISICNNNAVQYISHKF